MLSSFLFFFHATASTEIYTLSLHDALPIFAPHKRPFHTIIPAFMERGDEHIGFGIMGGSNQPLAHAQFVSDVADYGWNIQAALSAPRFTIRDTGEPIKCTILIESRVAPQAQTQLRKQGHELVLRK